MALCKECNEPILLQPSSLPILGGDYVFIEKKKEPQTSASRAWGGGNKLGREGLGSDSARA